MSDAEGCGNRCQLSDRLAEIATLRAENSTIKSVLSLVPGKCIYCGLEDWSKCPSGFPGCARADDMLCGEDEASRRLIAERDTLRAALDKYGDGQDWIQRAMQAEIERDSLRELVLDVYKRGMVWPEWDERARKALKGTKWATI